MSDITLLDLDQEKQQEDYSDIMEESHYWHVIMDVIDVMHNTSYAQVMYDLNNEFFRRLRGNS